MSLHVEVDQLLAPYALDAISQGEAAIVRAHLVECDECSATLARLTAVTAALPLAIEQVAPPASLRSRLLAEVDSGGRHRLPRPADAARLLLGRRVADMRLRELISQPRRWVPAAAVAAVIAGLVVWNVNLQGQLASSDRGGKAAVVTGGMSDLQHASIGTVTYIAADHVAVVSLRSLQRPSPGRIYELWFIGGDAKPEPAGLFSPGADGSKVLLLPRALHPGDTIAVTDEPVAGSQVPTTTPFITGHI
jgi:anti-sigma-K factor RskA